MEAIAPQLSHNTKNCSEDLQRCSRKERGSSNYSRNVGRLQEETKTQQAKKKIITGMS